MITLLQCSVAIAIAASQPHTKHHLDDDGQHGKAT